MNRRALGMKALAAGLVAAGPSWAKTSDKTLSAPDPLISYEGRTAVMDDGRVRAGFPGVVLRLRFKAKKVVLKTAASSDTVYLDLVIDKDAPKTLRLAKGEQDITLFEGKADVWHEVEITRRTESWQGVWDIISLSLEGGKLGAPAPLKGPRLMFIGDSVTCGEQIDAAPDETRSDIVFANAGKSYGKVLAKKLGAQCHLVSCGGRGLIRDWQGHEDGQQAPAFYERAAPDEPSKPWNHQAYVPDAIGIALGTNDFSRGIPDAVIYTDAYVAFVQKIRRDAPKAFIVLIDSPILTDQGEPKRAALSAYIDEVVARLKDPRVVHGRIGHYPGRPSNAHPIAFEHTVMAAELEPVFRTGIEG